MPREESARSGWRGIASSSVKLRSRRSSRGTWTGKDLRARFLLEAEITGNLEHPGIVPVYSLGRNAAGRPFYAMRFIRGETLSAAIKLFHEAPEGSHGESKSSLPLDLGVEFQQLLRRFLDVCDAMEYAHSRGVIHRDLKPGNIMLGQYGETLVVDWGLAKVHRQERYRGECTSGGGEASRISSRRQASGVRPSPAPRLAHLPT